MRIDLRGVYAGYGRKPALDNVSFSVERGSVFAVLGRNGAGKSTLVKLLLGQRPRSAGTIEVDGLDPWLHRARLMARLGATPETPDAPSDLSLTEIARFAAPLYSTWGRAAFAARLERFGIPLRARFGELSRGQKGLAHLALALAPEPELLILDDPTLGLDPVARRFVFDELIVELSERETTVVLTSHDLEGIERVATHVAILDEGRIACADEIEALRASAVTDGIEAPTLEEIFVRRTSKEIGA